MEPQEETKQLIIEETQLQEEMRLEESELQEEIQLWAGTE